jgi:tetratricopeptide (TPR) repeat protein
MKKEECKKEQRTPAATGGRTALPFAFFLLHFALLAATSSPSSDPDELTRAANAAFARGELAEADRLYQQAGERTRDPGLVAFNRAAVFAAKGELWEAERHYLRALDDKEAPADRRAKAGYNRGVCLLTRGGPAAVYRSAIAAFEQSLEVLPADDPLAADARHNLELAKLLWLRAREKEAKRPRPSDLPPDLFPEPPKPPELGGSDPDPGGADATAGGPDPGGPAGVAGNGSPAGGRKAPGAGNLPVLLDSDQQQPLSPQDAKAHLRAHADRIAADRQKTARLLVGPERPNVRDW